MKKFFAAIICLLILSSTPSIVKADPGPGTTFAGTPTTMDARSSQLLQRLEEVKTLDHSSLSREEKKQLRKEVRSIRPEMKAVNNGIYLSFGAIIIILLLLILILK